MTWRGAARWGARALGGLVVLVLVGMLAGRIYGTRRLHAAQEAFVEKVGPLELVAWELPSVPEDENAAIPIRAGALGLVLSTRDRDLLGALTRDAAARASPEQEVELRRVLADNALALGLLRKGALLERASFGTQTGLNPRSGDADLGLGLIWSARLLRAQARLARQDGDREGLMATLQTMFGLERAIGQESRTIDLIIVGGIERHLLGAVAEVGTAPETSDRELEELQRLVRSVSDVEQWKRTSAIAAIESYASLSKEAMATMAERKPYFWEHVLGALFIPIYRSGPLEQAAEMVDVLDQPAGTYWPVWQEKWACRGLTPLTIFKLIGASDSVRMAARLQGNMAQRQLVSVGLRLRREALASGAYPTDLFAIPAAADPDPFTGKPLLYSLHGDGSATLSIPDGEEVLFMVTKGVPSACPFTLTLPPAASSTVSE